MLVILGTLTIKWNINVIKEREIDELYVSLNRSRISHLLACHSAELSIKSKTAVNYTMDPTNLIEVVRTTKKEEINTSSSNIIHAWSKTMFLGSNMHVMTQALEEGDGPCLPHRLSIMNTYIEMATGSKWVAVMVKNLTATSITIAKGDNITWVIAVNTIPQVGVSPGTLEKLDKMQQIQRGAKMSVEERKEVLFQQLDMSCLEGWPTKNQSTSYTLLAECHDIFSLELVELGHTDLATHKIKVTDDEPFKERFWRIPPPMEKEMNTHVKEMLEVGIIHQSQSPWCNAVVMLCKKDGGLCFYFNFHKLNVRTKKDSYQLQQIQEVIKSLVGVGYFSCLDLKAGFWQIIMDEASKQYNTFTVQNIGFFECKCMLFGLCNTPATYQRLMQNCLGELNLTYCLTYLDEVIIFS